MSKNTDSFTTPSFFHSVLQGWQKRVNLRKNFSSHRSFNGSSNRSNDLEKLASSNNRQVDHENAQFNVEKATDGLFSFDHSDEHHEVSIGSVEK